jgi:hypothetical protein
MLPLDIVAVEFNLFLFLWCPSLVLYFHAILVFYILLIKFIEIVVEFFEVVSLCFSHWFEMFSERCLESSVRGFPLDKRI